LVTAQCYAKRRRSIPGEWRPSAKSISFASPRVRRGERTCGEANGVKEATRLAYIYGSSFHRHCTSGSRACRRQSWASATRAAPPPPGPSSPACRPRGRHPRSRPAGGEGGMRTGARVEHAEDMWQTDTTDTHGHGRGSGGARGRTGAPTCKGHSVGAPELTTLVGVCPTPFGKKPPEKLVANGACSTGVCSEGGSGGCTKLARVWPGPWLGGV